jgi:hypothetical protein
LSPSAKRGASTLIGKLPMSIFGTRSARPDRFGPMGTGVFVCDQNA